MRIHKQQHAKAWQWGAEVARHHGQKVQMKSNFARAENNRVGNAPQGQGANVQAIAL